MSSNDVPRPTSKVRILPICSYSGPTVNMIEDNHAACLMAQRAERWGSSRYMRLTLALAVFGDGMARATQAEIERRAGAVQP